MRKQELDPEGRISVRAGWEFPIELVPNVKVIFLAKLKFGQKTFTLG